MHNNTATNQTHELSLNKVATFWQDAEFNRYGISPMLLILMGCIGGAAAAHAISYENALMLSIIACTTMFVEVMILAIAPMRIIIYGCVVAAVADALAFVL